MQDGARINAFVGSSDLARSRVFYGGTLGLGLEHADPGAEVFDAGGAELRVTLVADVAPVPYTTVGWAVDDMDAAVDALRAAGVAFRRFDGMDQDSRGVWTAPGGGRVAWFEDPDGNLLSLSQHAHG